MLNMPWKIFSGGCVHVSMPLNLRKRTFPALMFSLMMISLVSAGCGGGGSSADTSTSTSTSTATPKILGWTPPQTYSDQTPLDPAKDLNHYEIHINDTGDFSRPDVTEATVSAIDSANGQLVTSFDLANLGVRLSKNVTYYVSMRSVSNTGVISDFSPAVSFSL